METEKATKITVEATVKSSIDKVWKYWTEPKHIMQWNNASEDWYCPKAINDLHTGGTFVFTMAARDGSMSFDFNGTYDDVQRNKYIAYTIGDGRKVEITFVADGDVIKVIETFDIENTHAPEMQKGGWQAILNNFKNYTEKN